MFTRLTATVIISAPDASCALSITAGELYLPVPTIRRDENVLSAIVKMSIMAGLVGRLGPDPRLSSADEIDDFDAIAVLHERVGIARPFEHRQVVLDGDAARIDLEAAEQFDDRDWPCKLDPLAVERDLQSGFDFIV